MKIYIAGKIAGDRRYRAKFREAAKTLEAAGHVVLNPATLPDGLTDGDYMRIALAMLEASDLAVFLPDYQESRGAMVEWAWCQRTGKECALYLDMTGGGAKRAGRPRRCPFWMKSSWTVSPAAAGPPRGSNWPPAAL